MNEDLSTISLMQLIEARQFNWVCPLINDESFPKPVRIGYNHAIFNFKRDVSSDKAVSLIRAYGYKPATSYDALLWDEWDGKNSIVALGDTTKDENGEPVVLCLDGCRRHLILCYWDGVDWASHYYSFLGVR